MAQPQLLTGARGVIKRYNPEAQQFETIAFTTDITVNVRVGARQTYVMGRMNAAVTDNLSYDVDVSLGRVVPVNKPDGTTLQQSTVSAVGAGLEPLIALMVTAQDIQIAIQDKVTGKYFSAVRGCRFAGRTLSTNVNDVSNERLNFVGIYDSGYENENSATDGYGL